MCADAYIYTLVKVQGSYMYLMTGFVNTVGGERGLPIFPTCDTDI